MDPTLIDNLGRTITPLISSLDALRSALGSTKTGDPTPVGTGDPKAMNDLTSLMTEFVKDFKKSADEEKALLTDIVNAMKSGKAARSGRARKGSTGSGTSAAPTSAEAKLSQNLADSAEQTARGAASSRKEYTGMRALAEKLNVDLKVHDDLIRKALRRLYDQNDISYDQLQFVTELDDVSQELLKKEIERLKYAKKHNYAASGLRSQLQEINSYTSTYNSSLGIQTNLTEGLVKEEAQFTRDVRAAAYETAGITKNSRSLQRVYEDIGSSVRATGVDRTKFQQSYMKALKGGVKDLKDRKSVV